MASSSPSSPSKKTSKTVDGEQQEQDAAAATTTTALVPVIINNNTAANNNNNIMTTTSSSSLRNTSSSSSSTPGGVRSQTSSVHVGVRIRPLTEQEVSQGGKSVLSVHGDDNSGNKNKIRLGEQRTFTFDEVFHDESNQIQLYDKISQPLLSSVLQGYNATIMAYGQTGSGKTFTMGSEAHTELELSDSTGLIPRFMNDLFDQLERMKQQRHRGDESGDENNYKKKSNNNMVLKEYHLQASFLEVYGEDVHDLLDPSRQTLPVREDANGGTVCSGLTCRAVESAAQALQVLHEGTLHRTTAATLMNLTSSRSHAVFTVVLSQLHQPASSSTATTNEKSGSNTTKTAVAPLTTTSKFTFVDLAGSERMKKTGAQGERAKEGIKINEGLLALGNVINALADQEKHQEKKIHVPYRQSKLTRLLQDALGGNSQTFFMACVSPSDINASETLSTLHYANRAKNIQNTVSKNIDSDSNTAILLRTQQHFQCLTNILQAELVKHKFATTSSTTTTGEDETKNDDDKIGTVDSALMTREDVISYMRLLQSAAEEQSGSTGGHNQQTLLLMPDFSQPVVKKIGASSHANTIESTAAAAFASSSSTMDSAPTTMVPMSPIGETNPDEDMAIVDQLLDMVQKENEFGEADKEGSEELQRVEGELEEQESLLTQLRDSLKVYHNMKEKYESVMSELHQLEMEKTHLAEQLEKVKADPSKGCSSAIKRKLAKVEKSLVLSQQKAQQHREMYRKAEREAQKCRMLESKVRDLKASKANLIKKQKEAAARHREYMDARTREVATLKRKERKTETQVSKLQNKIDMQERNLEKRQIYCQKMDEKLKRSQADLMKLLTSRRNESRGRMNRTSHNTMVSTRRRPPRHGRQDSKSQEIMDAALTEDESKSLKLDLDKAISEHVKQAQLQVQYEKLVVENTEVVQNMLASMKSLQEVKRREIAEEEDDDSREDREAKIRDLEHTIEELELKTELLEPELQDLRSQVDCSIPPIEDLTEGKNAPALQMLFLDTFGRLTEVEAQNRRHENAVQRKDSALKSYENEVEALHQRIAGLVKDLSRRHSVQKEDPVDIIRRLETAKASLEEQVADAKKEVESLSDSNHKISEQQRRLESQHGDASSRLAAAEVALKQLTDKDFGMDAVASISKHLDDIGAPSSERDSAQQQIASCLDDTCNRLLNEVQKRKTSIESEIQSLQMKVTEMTTALGKQHVEAMAVDGTTLLEQLSDVQRKHDALVPSFESAQTRRRDLRNHANALVDSMGIVKGGLDEETQQFLADSQTQVESDGSLSDRVLDRWEKFVTGLRIKKSEIIVNNAQLQKSCFTLVSDMGLNEGQTLSLVVQSMKKNGASVPEWWETTIAEAVIQEVVTSGGIVRTSEPFARHLAVIQDAVEKASRSRFQLSKALRGLVERAQKTLLKTVEGGSEASEAYASYHRVLLGLPPLSKEFVYACVTEVGELISAVDSMSQSEIEMVTVVWEALNVQAAERGMFWESVEKAVAASGRTSRDPFEDIMKSSPIAGEEWVLDVAKDVMANFEELDIRLSKLEHIHHEVERLRARQDTKSRILSLDSELRILSSKLSDFEDKKESSKQRLLSKKTASSALLKEERFRKQMKAKFGNKLEQFATLLKTWKQDEGSDFDANLLSDEVRTIFRNSDKMGTGALVEKRTEFMHLRTVKGKTKRKIPPTGSKSGSTPQRKRLESTYHPVPRPAAAEARVPRREDAHKKRAAVPAGSARKRKTDRAGTPIKGLRRAAESGKQSASSGSARQPLSPNHEPKRARKTAGTKSKRLTLPPFGHVLQQSLTPPKNNKENGDVAE